MTVEHRATLSLGKASPPLIVAGGGGGRADFMGQNDPDATQLFNPAIHHASKILQQFAKQENLNIKK